MRVLVADDDRVTREVVKAALESWGFEVVVCGDGRVAFETLRAADGPPLAILDWMMPELDGPSVCRALREESVPGAPRYLVLLTARDGRHDLVAGLDAGADDYITKPFDPGELRARVRVGVRVVTAESVLSQRLAELEEALAQVRQLRGLLPICSYCHKVRDDKNYWRQIEEYVSNHADVRFSHGVCPDCYAKVAAEWEDDLGAERDT